MTDGTPDTAAEPGAETPIAPYTSGLQQLTRVLGSVVAPTTLASGLLYYFGWNETGWYFSYFGVNANVLNFSTVDYLTWSVDALFVPLTAGAVVGLLALWSHALLHDRIAALPPSRFRVLAAGLGVTGLLLVGAGGTSVLHATPLSAVLAAAPLSLASGVLLLGYTKNLWQTREKDIGETAEKDTDRPVGKADGAAATLEWAIVFVLVAVSLFWATADYSAAVGTGRAHKIVNHLATYPDAAVYSQKNLSLGDPGVTLTRCRDPQAGYSYRYDGLKLLLRSGDLYLLISSAWSPAHGTAVLLPRDTVRLEFQSPTTHTATPPTC